MPDHVTSIHDASEQAAVEDRTNVQLDIGVVQVDERAGGRVVEANDITDQANLRTSIEPLNPVALVTGRRGPLCHQASPVTLHSTPNLLAVRIERTANTQVPTTMAIGNLNTPIPPSSRRVSVATRIDPPATEL